MGVKSFFKDAGILAVKFIVILGVVTVFNTYFTALFGENVGLLVGIVVFSFFLIGDDLFLKRDYIVSKKDGRILGKAIKSMEDGELVKTFMLQGKTFSFVNNTVLLELLNHKNDVFQALCIIDNSSIKDDECIYARFISKDGNCVSISKQKIDISDIDFERAEEITIHKGKTGETGSY